MGYNHYSAFQEPTKPLICQTCAQQLGIAAVIRYQSEHPGSEGTFDVHIDIGRRMVVVNAIPVEEYPWSELGIEPC